MEPIQFLLQQSLQQQINALAKKPDNSPVGSVIAFAGSVAPTGWLLCNGSSVSSTEYPDLYAVIGTAYGGGDGNFNLPNLVEKFIQGASPDTLATTGGGSITITADNLPQHSHSLNSSNAPISSIAGDHTHSLPSLLQAGFGLGYGNTSNIIGSQIDITGTNSAYTITSTISGSTELSATPNTPAIPVVPYFLALNYIIYAGN